jgi:hypothetical protein
MRTGRAVPFLLAAAAVGCGNPIHTHYGVKGTAACLRKLGYSVDTNAAKLGPVEGSATEGALLATEPGNAVRITFSEDHAQALNIVAAYRRFVPKRERKHLGDVLSSQRNATLLWTITPPPDELQRVRNCLQ